MLVVHPTEDRLLSIEELRYLMGIPETVKMINKKDYGKYFQNVPANTAAYWINEAVEVLNGNRSFSDKTFLKQNNIKKKFE
jgi:hypothetical protein